MNLEFLNPGHIDAFKFGIFSSFGNHGLWHYFNYCHFKKPQQHKMHVIFHWWLCKYFFLFSDFNFAKLRHSWSLPTLNGRQYKAVYTMILIKYKTAQISCACEWLESVSLFTHWFKTSISEHYAVWNGPVSIQFINNFFLYFNCEWDWWK